MFVPPDSLTPAESIPPPEPPYNFSNLEVKVSLILVFAFAGGFTQLNPIFALAEQNLIYLE